MWSGWGEMGRAHLLAHLSIENLHQVLALGEQLLHTGRSREPSLGGKLVTACTMLTSLGRGERATILWRGRRALTSSSSASSAEKPMEGSAIREGGGTQAEVSTLPASLAQEIL